MERDRLAGLAELFETAAAGCRGAKSPGDLVDVQLFLGNVALQVAIVRKAWGQEGEVDAVAHQLRLAPLHNQCGCGETHR